MEGGQIRISQTLGGGGGLESVAHKLYMILANLGGEGGEIIFRGANCPH